MRRTLLGSGQPLAATAAMGALVLGGFALTPVALAQSKTKTPPVGGDILAKVRADAHLLCEAILTTNVSLLNQYEAEGWSHDNSDYETRGPFLEEVFADRTYDGVGVAYVYASQEIHGDFELGYCSFEMTDIDAAIDIAPLADLPGFVGQIKPEGPHAYGAWQREEGDDVWLMLASQNPYRFFFQLTYLDRIAAN